MAAPSIVGRFRKRYVLSLLAIGSLFALTQVVLLHVMWTMTSDAAVINVAGRQRMLSQRIDKAAERLYRAIESGDEVLADEAHQTLRESLQLWSQSHKALERRDGTMELYGANTVHQDSQLEELARRIEAISNDVQEILRASESGEAGLASIGVCLDRMAEHESAFLVQMDALVNDYQYLTDRRLHLMVHAKHMIIATTLLVLVGICLFVLEPIARRLAYEIRYAEEEAERAKAMERVKGEFLANMSHELRTPLTAILGYSDLLRAGLLEGAAREQAVETISSSGKHLLQLINDVLDESKIERGKLALEWSEVKVPEVVLEVMSLLRVQAREKRIKLKAVAETELPMYIRSDAHRLKQILLNITGNAIKFTDEGSVELFLSLVDGVLIIKIRDTGIGMTSEQMERLFRSWSQADSSMARRFGGTGLGLSISKSLVEMMGGGITVESSQGEGSCFRIALPCGTRWAQDKSARWPAGPLEAQVSGDRSIAANRKTAAEKLLDGCRILLAEDGVDNQRLITFHLKRAGATVTLAEDGVIARDLILAGPGAFDVVCMDLQMPRLDGLSAIKAVRARGVTLPIVALTAHAMASDRAQCFSAGCNEYATKPIDAVELIATVARAWKGLGGSREAA